MQTVAFRTTEADRRKPGGRAGLTQVADRTSVPIGSVIVRPVCFFRAGFASWPFRKCSGVRALY